MRMPSTDSGMSSFTCTHRETDFPEAEDAVCISYLQDSCHLKSLLSTFVCFNIYYIMIYECYLY